MNNRRGEATAAAARQRRDIPTGYLWTRFVRFYGMEAWERASYPTTDHIIPFRLFYAMAACIPAIEAVEQVLAYHAGLLAGAAVHGGEDGKAARERHIEQLWDAGHPEVRETPPVTAPVTTVPAP